MDEGGEVSRRERDAPETVGRIRHERPEVQGHRSGDPPTVGQLLQRGKDHRPGGQGKDRIHQKSRPKSACRPDEKRT